MMKIMANLISPEPFIVSSESQESDSPRTEQAGSLPPSADSGSPWNFTTIVALLLLIVLWAVKLYTTWGAWGNLTIDSGHEMYVPAMLAEGKQLYRDVWFTYGPAAPYFTSYLFRLFGAQLNVLYWAGSLSALGSAIFLYPHRNAVVLLAGGLDCWCRGSDRGFSAFHFLFSSAVFMSAAVYGCFIGCLFLWLCQRLRSLNDGHGYFRGGNRGSDRVAA